MFDRRHRMILSFAGVLLLLAGCTEGTESEQPNAQPGEVDGVTNAEDDPDPATPPTELGSLPGQIILRDGFGQIVVTAPDGSASTTLTEPGDEHSQPTWSSSGERVAWSSFGPDGAALTTANPDGSDARSESMAAPPFYMSWSPDDAWIGGLRSAGPGMEMFFSPTNGSDGRPITNAQPFYFEWAGDDDIVAAVGSQLLVDISAAENSEPAVRDLGAPLGFFQALAILPDGDVLAAVDFGDNSLVRVSGSETTVIATADSIMFLSASPDGSQVAVLVAPAGGSTEPEPQVIGYQFEEPVELESGRVTVIDLTTGDVEVRPEDDVIAVQWSPDSTTLAALRLVGPGLRWSFETNGVTTDGATFVPSERFVLRYLPFFDQYNLSSTWWSPDSEAIVFAGTVENETGVFVDVLGSSDGPTLISEGDIAFWSPR